MLVPSPPPVAHVAAASVSFVPRREDGRTVFVRGRADDEPTPLYGVAFKRMTYRRGVLTLAGLTGSCGGPTSVRLQARGASVRGIALSGDGSGSPCPPTIRIRTGTSFWTAATVGIPGQGPPLQPDPSRTPTRTQSPSAAFLEPDRLHVAARVDFGGCDALQARSASYDGKRISVRITLGVPADAPQPLVCPAIAGTGWTIVTLSARVPAGTPVTM